MEVEKDSQGMVYAQRRIIKLFIVFDIGWVQTTYVF